MRFSNILTKPVFARSFLSDWENKKNDLKKCFLWVYAMVWMCVSPQTSHVEIRIPKSDVMVLPDGAFGRCLSHEGGILMNGSSVL